VAKGEGEQATTEIRTVQHTASSVLDRTRLRNRKPCSGRQIAAVGTSSIPLLLPSVAHNHQHQHQSNL